MRYIIDFDGVIFNTKRLKEKAVELGFADNMRSREMLEAAGKEFVQSLVEADAKTFLEKYALECVVVSSAYSQDYQVSFIPFQELKIEWSGLTDIISADSIHIVADSKADELLRLEQECAAAGESCVFVDDWVQHLETAKEIGIQGVLMDRGEDWQAHGPSTESKEFPRVSNFNEFEAFVETWQNNR